MNAIDRFVLRRGCSILFLPFFFARQVGLPVPAPWFLLPARCSQPTGNWFSPPLGLAVTACALAD